KTEIKGPPHAERPHRLLFTGLAHREAGAEEMVRAVGRLDGLSELRVLGRWSPAGLEAEMAALPGWERVRFLGWQSQGVVAEEMAAARAGVVLFRPLPRNLEAQPRKLFEYMSGGLPVIASRFPLWEEIVENNGCGLLVDPEDVTE